MHSAVQTAVVTIISYKPLSGLNFARYTGQLHALSPWLDIHELASNPGSLGKERLFGFEADQREELQSLLKHMLFIELPSSIITLATFMFTYDAHVQVQKELILNLLLHWPHPP